MLNKHTDFTYRKLIPIKKPTENYYSVGLYFYLGLDIEMLCQKRFQFVIRFNFCAHFFFS